MHISEGVLPPAVLLGGAICGVALLAFGLKKLPWDSIMPTAVFSAAFFTASLVHVPVLGASAHLLLNGLLGCVLGAAAVPAIFAALLLQALFFQFGGLTTLGVNTTIMALPALVAALLCRPFLAGKGWGVAAFLCGSLSVLMSALLAALCLALAGEVFNTAAAAIILAHIPVCLLEGVITVLIVGYLRRVKPQILFQSADV